MQASCRWMRRRKYVRAAPAALSHQRQPEDHGARSAVARGGFVTDDPWGDRQLAMSEADFSRLVAGRAVFARARHGL